MIPDRHTACPACAVQVRDAYDALVLVLEAIAECPPGALPTELREAAGAVRYAIDRLAPLVIAHGLSQVHAFSPELEDARHPTVGDDEEADDVA